VGTTIWLLADKSSAGTDEQAGRETVMAQSEQFMLRVNTYGPDLLDEKGEMPDYRKLVLEIITPKFKSSFEQGVTAAEQTVSQSGLGRTSQVFSTGVSSMDQDSAVVLVAGTFTNSYPKDPQKPDGKRVDSEPVPFRVKVNLVKTDGKWLVDDFAPVIPATQ
jgi:hypothetical protein